MITFLVILCIYLWLLLTFAAVFFTEKLGSPYSILELTMRSFALPVVFPFFLILQFKRNR